MWSFFVCINTIELHHPSTALQHSVTKPHRYRDGRVAEVFEGLTFVTVIGAGHEVLLSKPHAAFELFKYFLRGKPLPK
ncbi:hypothetical protein Bca4012_091338 [Brassica carinata]